MQAQFLQLALQVALRPLNVDFNDRLGEERHRVLQHVHVRNQKKALRDRLGGVVVCLDVKGADKKAERSSYFEN